MKCWLASFPRSGNTYFRNILYYVYGVESSTWHKESRYPVDKHYDQFHFVKTHLLPDELEPDDKSIPAIYLVRDGRDALVSIAHHRSDIVEPGSDFSDNLYEAIIANNGSFFGGWSKNVNAWLKRADIVIRFEDLIKDPERVFKRVEALIDLPEGNWNRLPDFKKLKFGQPKYGGQTTSKEIKIPDDTFSEKFFRKGKSGAWQEDMSADHLDMFWHFHADMMDRMGYPGSPSGIPQNRVLDSMAIQKLGIQDQASGNSANQNKPARVLIDGHILSSNEFPSAKRNFFYFLRGLNDVNDAGSPNYIFDVLIDGNFIPLQHLLKLTISKRVDKKTLNRILIFFKHTLSSLLSDKLYFGLARVIRNTAGNKKWVSGLKKATGFSGKQKIDETFIRSNSQFENYDLYHIPFLGAQSEIHNLPVKTVITVHILNIESQRKKIKRQSETVYYNADFFITAFPSISVKLQTSLNIEEGKLFVVAQTPEKEFFYKSNRKSRVTRTLKKYSILHTTYFICESYHHESEETFINILKGFLQFKTEHPSANVKLLILGNRLHIEKYVSMGVINEKYIIFSGRVEETDLKILYSGALAFIQYKPGIDSFFSVSEASLCKVPVICCNGFMAEELKENSLIADPTNVENISEKLGLLYSNQKLRNELVNKSYKETLELTLRKTVSETLNVYKNISGL